MGSRYTLVYLAHLAYKGPVRNRLALDPGGRLILPLGCLPCSYTGRGGMSGLYRLARHTKDQ